MIYGIAVGLDKFSGNSATNSDMVLKVAGFLAEILFAVSIIKLILNHIDRGKKCILSIIKLNVMTIVTYIVSSRVLTYLAIYGFVGAIIFTILSITLVIVIIKI